MPSSFRCTDFSRTGGDGAESVTFHDFNCIPGPQLLKVTASSSPPAPWTYYPGELVRVNVEPDFGWINVVISPFLPRIQAWFDPREGWFFVGGESSRYYKGLKYMMVRATAAGPEIRLHQLRSSGPAYPASPAQLIIGRTLALLKISGPFKPPHGETIVRPRPSALSDKRPRHRPIPSCCRPGRCETSRGPDSPAPPGPPRSTARPALPRKCRRQLSVELVINPILSRQHFRVAQ